MNWLIPTTTAFWAITTLKSRPPTRPRKPVENTNKSSSDPQMAALEKPALCHEQSPRVFPRNPPRHFLDATISSLHSRGIERDRPANVRITGEAFEHSTKAIASGFWHPATLFRSPIAFRTRSIVGTATARAFAAPLPESHPRCGCPFEFCTTPERRKRFPNRSEQLLLELPVADAAKRNWFSIASTSTGVANRRYSATMEDVLGSFGASSGSESVLIPITFFSELFPPQKGRWYRCNSYSSSAHPTQLPWPSPVQCSPRGL